MKKALRPFLLLALIFIMFLCLSTCGEKSPNAALNGTYELETLWNRVTFSFDGEETVTVKCFAAGYLYYTQRGTYQLSETGDEITLSLSTQTGTAHEGDLTYSGTFSFSWEDDYILIGDVRYNRTEEEFMRQESRPPEQDEYEPSELETLAPEPSALSGTYVIGSYWSQMSYTFDENGNVTVNHSTGDYTYYTQTGTYQLSETGDEITLSLSTQMGTTHAGDFTYSGTFSFSKGEVFILIGNLRYELADDYT